MINFPGKFGIKAGIILACVLSPAVMPEHGLCRDADPVFSSDQDIREFYSQISELVEQSWKIWQDDIVLNNVEINGGRGRMSPGGMTGPVMTARKILRGLKGKDIPAGRMKCFRAAAEAISDSMREWQRGYCHENIPFPEGSSSSFSLTPCVNVPVSVGSGYSSGSRKITEDSLYDHMIYRGPSDDESARPVFLAVSRAFIKGFKEWEKSCFIEGIKASGGFAPAPGPMGMGPGPVKGAKGSGGKLTGAYFSGGVMYDHLASPASRGGPSGS